MGPKLFNVYLNDLPYVSDDFEMALFADNKDKLYGVESNKYKPVSDSTQTQFEINFVQNFER